MFDPARSTRRVWRTAAKSVCLNLTPGGQLWVESRGSDVVSGKLDPSGTAGALSPAPSVASRSRWGRPGYVANLWLNPSDPVIQVTLWCGPGNDHWSLCLLVGRFSREVAWEYGRCVLNTAPLVHFRYCICISLLMSAFTFRLLN